MQIKVNKRNGKFHVVHNSRSGAKYIAPFGHETREAAAIEAKLYRSRELSTAVIFSGHWKKEMQTF